MNFKRRNNITTIFLALTKKNVWTLNIVLCCHIKIICRTVDFLLGSVRYVCKCGKWFYSNFAQVHFKCIKRHKKMQKENVKNLRTKNDSKSDAKRIFSQIGLASQECTYCCLEAKRGGRERERDSFTWTGKQFVESC